LREVALKRVFSDETRKKMYLNNGKSVKIPAYYLDSSIKFKVFNSIADAAEFFLNDRNSRG
jgi:hypothetical protein